MLPLRSVFSTSKRVSDSTFGSVGILSKSSNFPTFACLAFLSNKTQPFTLKGTLREYCESYEYTLGTVQALSLRKNVDTCHYKFSEPFDESRIWDFRWHKIQSRIACVGAKDVFWKGYEMLERYQKNEPLTQSEATAISALEQFYANKEKHEESLKQLQSRNLSDTDVAALFACHLLSQLIPHPSQYFLDGYSVGLSGQCEGDVCPCGCEEIIPYGLSSIGSPQLFYGVADIVLFPTETNGHGSSDDLSSAVFTLKRTDKESYNLHGESVIQNDRNSDEDEGIIDANTNQMLFRQAISLSLCKQCAHLNEKVDISGRENPNISCVFPVCGISSNTYIIVLYDTENDYLLRMVEGKRIFDGGKLLFSSVVDIWMVIYHRLFCSGPSQMIQSALRGTCSLANQVGREKYRAIIEDSKLFYRKDRPAAKSRWNPSLDDCMMVSSDNTLP